jgi:hypothetical protein
MSRLSILDQSMVALICSILYDGTILFHGSKERYIGESEVGIHLFKSHDDSSEVVYLKESYVKTEALSSNIYNNINILSLHNCEFITDN